MLNIIFINGFLNLLLQIDNFLLLLLVGFQRSLFLLVSHLIVPLVNLSFRSCVRQFHLVLLQLLLMLRVQLADLVLVLFLLLGELLLVDHPQFIRGCLRGLVHLLCLHEVLGEFLLQERDILVVFPLQFSQVLLELHAFLHELLLELEVLLVLEREFPLVEVLELLH